jgi:hypothetical protein
MSLAEDLSVEVDSDEDKEVIPDAANGVIGGDPAPPAGDGDAAKKPLRTAFTSAMEESGALDFLTDALLTMYTNPKPPPEVFNFFLSTLGTTESADIEKILLENQELRKHIAALKQQIAELETKVRK